ncbi:unnamed protein product [Penicillium nalgiovense]|uniref:Uncharacterized protein n=1 Tax=Penicillium nalgiovense TaxID=60175 RepID=A0A9W4HXN2_PENNA|nr:unnamed protein product [Penicillium nalgiovense]CAG8135027.1 unnamed protein product [Penicillium nalgiovense]CAG8136870.1 unnamed protein product [Penicillium nalgiovense]CAG8141140.1 unnamed protein product [Penicillium nalgiovense]CAG8141620.1 unnamed protein product [Penicillium nalgiovense]
MNNIRWTKALSLRGKKYHILRKQRRTESGSPKHAAHRNRAGTCRSVGRRASLGNLPSRRPAQSNIEKCFQTILRTEPSHIDSRAMPLLRPSRRQETGSSSQIWDYVHRVCASRKLIYRRAEHPCYQQFVGICATSRSRSSNSNYLDELVLLDVSTNREYGSRAIKLLPDYCTYEFTYYQNINKHHSLEL